MSAIELEALVHFLARRAALWCAEAAQNGLRDSAAVPLLLCAARQRAIAALVDEDAKGPAPVRLTSPPGVM